MTMVELPSTSRKRLRNELYQPLAKIEPIEVIVIDSKSPSPFPNTAANQITPPFSAESTNKDTYSDYLNYQRIFDYGGFSNSNYSTQTSNATHIPYTLPSLVPRNTHPSEFERISSAAYPLAFPTPSQEQYLAYNSYQQYQTNTYQFNGTYQYVNQLVPKKEIEVIDLTISPPPEEAPKRRRIAQNNYKATTRTQKPPVESFDDKEGHYIVRIDDELTPRFVIKRLLGQGTFGKVVEVLDRQDGMLKAIKIVRSIQKYRDASKVEIRMLQAVKRRDPSNKQRCIHLRDWFDYRNHICMVFDLLSSSVFDFLKENSFNPFPMRHIYSMAEQLLKSVAFLHDDLKMIHTDLKPENLMLQNNEFKVLPGKGKKKKELRDTSIQLIDFGSAIFEHDYHSSVVCTRHYRAPEIILGTSWSYPCDMWSVGCILVEFYTGDALFHTHDNLEHLALMEKVLGPIPYKLIQKSSKREFFTRDGRINFPQPNTEKSSIDYVLRQKKLMNIIQPVDQVTTYFLDLVQRILVYDPKDRLTAQQALLHPFFTSLQS